MWWLVIVILIVVMMVGILMWYYPAIPLSVVNAVYHLDSSARTNFYSPEECHTIFPVGSDLESVWQDIRNEGHTLYQSLANPGLNYLTNYHVDVGAEDMSNWTTIPLRLFGTDAPTYLEQCPITANILRQHPEIKSCLFSIMDPGKEILPHYGPYDGLLRYQLPLDIPQQGGELGECYLHVGGERHYWKAGQGVMFDEANLHGAVNTTQHSRMVLLIDLERPYAFAPFRWLNKSIIWGMGALPATSSAVTS